MVIVFETDTYDVEPADSSSSSKDEEEDVKRERERIKRG